MPKGARNIDGRKQRAACRCTCHRTLSLSSLSLSLFPFFISILFLSLRLSRSFLSSYLSCFCHSLFAEYASLAWSRSLDLWGHPRAVLRPKGAIQGGRRVPGHQLSFSGRFRGPRLLLGRNIPAALGTQGSFFRIVFLVASFVIVFIPVFAGTISGPYHSYPRKSREQTNYASIWFLRRVFAQIWIVSRRCGCYRSLLTLNHA